MGLARGDEASGVKSACQTDREAAELCVFTGSYTLFLGAGVESNWQFGGLDLGVPNDSSYMRYFLNLREVSSLA